MSADGKPQTPMERWYEHTHVFPNGKHFTPASDRPRVSVWMPTDLPSVRLQTSSHGCHKPDTLAPGRPVAYMTIGGCEIGGWLDELEMLLAATCQYMAEVRVAADQMIADRDAAAAGGVL